MALSLEELALVPLFEHAVELLDRGMLDDALRELKMVLAGLSSPEGKLLAHTHIKVGVILDKQHKLYGAERHFRVATEAAPRLELASLGLFHALWELDRKDDAITEIIRYLSLGRVSDDFEMLMNDEEVLAVLQGEEVELAKTARALASEAKKRRATPPTKP